MVTTVTESTRIPSTSTSTTWNTFSLPVDVVTTTITIPTTVTTLCRSTTTITTTAPPRPSGTYLAINGGPMDGSYLLAGSNGVALSYAMDSPEQAVPFVILADQWEGSPLALASDPTQHLYLHDVEANFNSIAIYVGTDADSDATGYFLPIECQRSGDIVSCSALSAASFDTVYQCGPGFYMGNSDAGPDRDGCTPVTFRVIPDPMVDAPAPAPTSV
ncbi:uncharacterized protein B0T15DRAFT_525187 [Chaetomium strumarium]|uniref:Uncharacterized protein n=1 Tax=Chaetomium strumarium TaxID=1170767 RepID=A0AAJ0M4R9_9PEZI|nr:hypothetical protein B0T15DRAFT_525187 [Chaetomium strumarium]